MHCSDLPCAGELREALKSPSFGCEPGARGSKPHARVSAYRLQQEVLQRLPDSLILSLQRWHQCRGPVSCAGAADRL